MPLDRIKSVVEWAKIMFLMFAPIGHSFWNMNLIFFILGERFFGDKKILDKKIKIEIVRKHLSFFFSSSLSENPQKVI